MHAHIDLEAAWGSLMEMADSEGRGKVFKYLILDNLGCMIWLNYKNLKKNVQLD